MKPKKVMEIVCVSVKVHYVSKTLELILCFTIIVSVFNNNVC